MQRLARCLRVKKVFDEVGVIALSLIAVFVKVEKLLQGGHEHPMALHVGRA